MDYKSLNANTRERLAKFARNFDPAAWVNRPMSELLDYLLADVTIAHAEELDEATQIALEILSNRFTDAFSENSASKLMESHIDGIFRQCVTEMYTGYLIGRSMLGTGRDALHFSNDSTQVENADKLIRLFSDPFITDRLDDAGPIPRLWENYRTEVAGQGPFSVLGAQAQKTIAAVSARAGMTLAVLEHDVFVEGGGSSVAAPSDLDHLAKLAVAVFKVNAQMGLEALRPGCGVLALEEVHAMKTSSQIYNSGDTDGFRLVIAAMPKSLDRRELALLGFTPQNRYPAKAVEYLKALIVVATDLGFREYSDDFIQMINSKPAGS